jgi:hypothetical protein
MLGCDRVVIPVLLVLAQPLIGAGGEERPATAIENASSVEAPFRFSVDRARKVALEKLASDKCQQLFAEFHDLDGHSLGDVLSGLGERSDQHLWRMDFRNGSGSQPCRRKGVYAFTSPGSLTVFLCPRFRGLIPDHGQDAANILIHEELHSLGAGEAPMPGLPTAYEITDRVERQCGR